MNPGVDPFTAHAKIHIEELPLRNLKERQTRHLTVLTGTHFAPNQDNEPKPTEIEVQLF